MLSLLLAGILLLSGAGGGGQWWAVAGTVSFFSIWAAARIGKNPCPVRENAFLTHGLARKVNFTGYTNNWIFLPAAGYRSNIDLNNVRYSGYYWSSSRYPSYMGFTDYAYNMEFNSSGVHRYNKSRYYGHSIRPVSE